MLPQITTSIAETDSILNTVERITTSNLILQSVKLETASAVFQVGFSGDLCKNIWVLDGSTCTKLLCVTLVFFVLTYIPTTLIHYKFITKSRTSTKFSSMKLYVIIYSYTYIAVVLFS